MIKITRNFVDDGKLKLGEKEAHEFIAELEMAVIDAALNNWDNQKQTNEFQRTWNKYKLLEKK